MKLAQRGDAMKFEHIGLIVKLAHAADAIFVANRYVGDQRQ